MYLPLVCFFFLCHFLTNSLTAHSLLGFVLFIYFQSNLSFVNDHCVIKYKMEFIFQIEF